jgi:DNA ligase-1
MRTQPQEIIKQLESDNSRLVKESVLANAMNEELDEFFEGIKLALDNLIVFGVKQVPVKETDEGQGLPWTAFVELADALRFRAITGNEARDAIKLAMDVSTQDQWNNWYRRILIKDLRCGVTEKTVNAVAKKAKKPQYKVPVFDVQLATDGLKHDDKMTGKKILQEKIDGTRCITVIDYEAHEVTQYTRNGKELVNFPHIKEELLKHIDDFGRSYVLDGEIMSENFQALMKQLNRKSNVKTDDAYLNVFDILPLTEFKAGVSEMGQRRRNNFLNTFKGILEDTGCIKVLPWIEVDLDTFIGEMEFKDFNQKCLDEGFEGIMVKDPDAKYECKRGTAWLKIKPFITVDLAIVGFEEGTGKNQGRLGAIICEGEDDGRKISVNVGGGFTDDERVSNWECKETMVGQVVEVRADAVSQNQDGTYSLRFPRFIRFRGFTRGEKI